MLNSYYADDEYLGPIEEAELAEANANFAKAHPGDSPGRQPVHTVYGGAQLFSSDTAQKIGRIARESIDAFAPDAASLGEALGISDHPALATIDARVRDKLQREPVEDFRIDFEDGYGNRPNAEEDKHAAQVAKELIRGMKEETLPPFIGLRIKPLNEEMRVRSIRTLELVLTALVEYGKIPDGFIITVPKITIIEQVRYFVGVLENLERKLNIEEGDLPFEVMVETPQMIVDG